MTWDITHFHFWVFQVFYPSNQLQTIRFCVKKTRWSGFFFRLRQYYSIKSFIKIVFLHNKDAINRLQLPDQPICGLLPISGIDSDVLSKFSPEYHWFSFQESMIMMTDTILMKDILKSDIQIFSSFGPNYEFLCFVISLLYRKLRQNCVKNQSQS